MPRRQEIARGTVLGCWVVLRPFVNDKNGQQRFTVRAQCCGREAQRLLGTLLTRPKTCSHCRGRAAPVALAPAIGGAS